MEDHTELKRLKSEVARLNADRESSERDLKEATKRLNTVKHRMKSIQGRIAKLTLKDQNVVVSEHAILRYLERVNGVPVGEIKNEIMPDSVEKQVKQLGNGKYPVNGSHTLVVKKGIVVTVLTPDGDTETPTQIDAKQAPIDN